MRRTMPLPSISCVCSAKSRYHHQADHFAGRVVLPGGLVAHLREPAQEFLEDGTHLVVRDLIRVQVHLRELVAHHEEQVVLRQLLHDPFELVVAQDLPHVLAEPVQVSVEVEVDVIRIIREPFEVEVGDVVEAHAPGRLEHDLFHLMRFEHVLEPLVRADDLVLLIPQHTIEPTQDDERQRHIPVFMRLEGSPQDVIGNLPDEIGFVLEVVRHEPKNG